jgi:hypothetical protein
LLVGELPTSVEDSVFVPFVMFMEEK